jgi:hypothetical protein
MFAAQTSDPMKKLLLILTLLTAVSAFAQSKWIFADSRVSGTPLTFTLYKKQPDNSYAVERTGTSNYTYMFDTLPAGIYRLHIDIGYTKYIPTWHPLKAYWEDAEDIDLTALDTFVAMAGLLPNPTLSGPGTLNGQLIEGMMKAQGDPMKNIRVVLVDGSDNFVKMVSTNDSGNFTATGLPLGTYKIKTDVMNAVNPAPKTVVLDSANMNATVSLTVNRTGNINTAVKNAVSPASTVTVFPNPAGGSVQVRATVPFSYELVNITGHTVKREQVEQDHASVDVSELRNGVYFLRVTLGTGISVHRLLVNN